MKNLNINNINILFISRILIGCLYIFSGVEKLLSPVENFIYVIQGYDLVHSTRIVKIAAISFPWLELIIGTFLFLGIWLKPALVGVGAFSAVFIAVVGQALIRRLEITRCGCFGDFVSVPLTVILILDILVLILTIILLTNQKKMSVFSLDNYFDKKQEKRVS